MELGGCPHRAYPGLDDCSAPTFPQTLPWDCPGNLRLAADYEKAIAKSKIVVFVRDNENRRHASMLFDYE